MKKGYVFLIIAVLFIWAVTAVLLVFTPDTVPVHYNAQGEVDRFGSKYEHLIIPLWTTVLAAIFAFMARKKTIPGEEKMLLITGGVSTMLLNALSIYFLVKAITWSEQADASSADVLKVTMIFLGVTITLLGVLMPRMPRSRIMGLRTKWSLSSETAWKKSQRFGGISAVVVGILTVIAACLLSGMAILIVGGVLLAVWVVASTVASYFYAKAEREDGNDA